VKPTLVDVIQDPVLAILQRGVELRVVPDLRSLRDAVIESTLEFSIIRWRNTSPRRAASQTAAPDGTGPRSRASLARCHRRRARAGGNIALDREAR
jgi:hypothetical protein